MSAQKRRPLLICGTRSLAADVADVVSDIPGMELSGFVENLDRSKAGSTLDGLPVFWIDDIAAMASTHDAVCALGTTRRSSFTAQMEALGFQFTVIVHPLARVSSSATLGRGTIVNPGVIIAAHATVGRHVYINRGALIGHHTTIGDHVSLMPGANVAGNVSIGERTFVGMGSIITNDITVGSDTVIGAGAVVTRNLPSNVQAVGMPARIIKEGIQGK